MGSWCDAEESQGLYNHVTPPNTWNCAMDTVKYHLSAATAMSRHSGEVNFFLMDGSVRFAKSSSNSSIWQAVDTRAGGEVLSADQL